MDNPEKQETLGTRHRTMTNKEKNHGKLKNEQQGTYQTFSGVHWCLRRL